MDHSIYSLARLVALSLLAVCFANPVFASSSTDTDTFSVEPALRELWERGSERFQRQWLIAGPVEQSDAQAIDGSTLKPAPGEPLRASDPSIRWIPQVSWTDITDLATVGNRTFDRPGSSIDRFIFAAATVRLASAGPMELSIGSERPYTVWLNGKLVHTRPTAAVFAPDADRIPVEMSEGDNLVLVRFHETSAGPSQFALRAVPKGTVLKKVTEIAPSIVESSDAVLAVRTHFAEESDAAPVLVEVLRAGGTVVAKQSAKRGATVRFNPRSWRDGAYEIRATTHDGWNRRTVHHLAWYKGDATVRARELLAAADKADNTPRGDSIRMLAAMLKSRLGGSLDNLSPSYWRRIHSPLMEFEELELEAQGREARTRGGGFVRLAYTDQVDGSTQWCRAFLPLDYARTKKWPLITFLHGYNPANPEYVDWWSVDERHNPVTDATDAIVIEPHGRGNAQYLGIGDRDVMRCIDEAKRRFSVDEDRVYLTGESMGGHGVWAVASRHPDVFAAAAPIYGGWDFRITNVSNPVETQQPKTEVGAFAAEAGSSFSHAENLLNVPLLIVHGDADTAVHVENSRHAVRMLQRWGYDVRYHEMPGWAHEDLYRIPVAEWLLQHTRKSTPRTVRLRATNLAGAAAYWVRAQRFENPAQVIRINAEVLEPGLVRVDSSNVAALSLEVPKSYRGARDSVRVVWNGETHTVTPDAHGRIELGSPSNARLVKRVDLEGPLPAVITTPFAVVVGTISPDALMRERIETAANRFAQQWLQWQKHPVRVLKDTEVTAEHERAYSLILLGGADANAVTKRFADKLPFSASSDGIVVDGRKFDVADSVLQAIYPSPAADDRYVYVVAATSADGLYFWTPQIVNFMQGFPYTSADWIIQDGRRPPPGTTDLHDAHVAYGIFDANWRRNDRWTVLRDEGVASKWTLRRAPAKDFVPSPEALEAAAGRYELFPGFFLTFRVENGRLVVDVPGQPTLSTIAESDWIYIDPSTDVSAEIVRDDAGNVIGASIIDTRGVVFAKRAT